jgi:hypothetical protein
MTGRTSGHAHINVVLSIITPVALSVVHELGMIGCLAEELEMLVFAGLGDEPMAISIHTILNKDLVILDCQRTISALVKCRV